MHRQKTACVTGASGMVGREIVQALLLQGWHVRVLTRKKDFPVDGVEVFSGELTDLGILLSFVEGADAVFHCAAELHDEARMHQTNVMGTQTILQAMAEQHVDGLCHLSSVGVMGPDVTGLVDEQADCHPFGTYEETKFAAERLVSESLACQKVSILRPTNVIDDTHPGILQLSLRQDWKSRLALLIKGGECAHLVHARDVAAAALHVMEHAECAGVYIVGLDEDDRNTVAGLAGLAALYQSGKKRRYWHLPAAASFWLRRLFKGRSLHGHTRFSSARLLADGFEFPLGLEGTVKRVVVRGWRIPG
jgi:nucleoside-diphosphate-sugar epimerase